METCIHHIAKIKRHTANVAFDTRVTTGLQTDQLERALVTASTPISTYNHTKFNGKDDILDQLVKTHGKDILEVIDEESIKLNNFFESQYATGSSQHDPLII